ncbi:MAG: nicotinamide mononucleotide transporter [Bacteroidales bacterium]|nr:nicotinamide mononucleotide transporter [Bacteroidales bacterium]
MSTELIFEIIGAVIGLVYLYLEYKADVWLWPVGILMSLFYVVIFFHGKFYADAAIYLYYIGANTYGLFQWTRSRQKTTTENDNSAEMPITHVPAKRVLPLAAVTLVLWMVLYLILKTVTDSPVPLGDAFTTSVSIVATWMLAQKYIEQWWLWVVVNIVSTMLYFWKGLYPTGVLFCVYVIVAILGYFRWRKEMVQDDNM